MKPLESMPEATRRSIRGVLTDIDETVSTHGRLTAEAYTALERLHRAGKLVIPITGRPAGWCDHIARFWPVDAVVGENGALYMRYDPAAHTLVRRFLDDEPTRRRHRERLTAIADRILAAVPGSALASDQRYREADVAIDFCEDIPPLDRAAIDRIVAMMEAEGMTAKVSSIHVNGWFGTYDKLTMTKHLLRESSPSMSMRSAPTSSSWAIRRTMRRCSRIFPTLSAWRTFGSSPIASRRCRRT
jgi:HAD superfamily hydrolase (TIGR01484 family)